MNIRRIALLIVIVIVSMLFFGITTFVATSVLLTILFVAFLVFLVLTILHFTKRLLILAILIGAVYFIVLAVPFPLCNADSAPVIQECDCTGFEKNTDQGTECVGKINSVSCYHLVEEVREDLPMENCTTTYSD